MKWFLLSLLVLSGCAVTYRPLPSDPHPVIINLCPKDFDRRSVDLWTAQAVRRFGNQVVILACHGSGKPWHIAPQTGAPHLDTNLVAWTLHSEYPSRRLVLLTCNPLNSPLEVPNCAYAKRSVWITPGWDWRYEWDENDLIYAVGNIDEFTLTPER